LRDLGVWFVLLFGAGGGIDVYRGFRFSPKSEDKIERRYGRVR